MAKDAVSGFAMTVVRTIFLAAVFAAVGVVGHSAHSAGSILWRSVEGTVVSADRVPDKGCVLGVQGAASIQTIAFARDACDRIHVGDRIRKAAWSLDIQNVSRSGTAWKASVSRVAFSIAALVFVAFVGVVAVLGIFIHLPVRFTRRAHNAG
jgi:hypothetical protein